MRQSYRPAIPPKPQSYRTQILDHLGLVAGMFAELGITEVIDLKFLPQKNKYPIDLSKVF